MKRHAHDLELDFDSWKISHYLQFSVCIKALPGYWMHPWLGRKLHLSVNSAQVMRQLASLIFAFSLRCCFQEVSKWDIWQIFVDGELDNCAIHLDTVAPKSDNKRWRKRSWTQTKHQGIPKEFHSVRCTDSELSSAWWYRLKSE